MNAMLIATSPLPAVLDQPGSIDPGRRHRIDGIDLSEGAVERFNSWLTHLGRRGVPLNRDHLATAARELHDTAGGTSEPPCIEQRMKLLEAAARMVADAQWKPADTDVADIAAEMVQYANGQQQLLPNSLPGIGRLDEAIAVDAAWPRLAAEVDAFLDYCRVRSLEAAMRGCDIGSFSFTREDWEQARGAEAELEHRLHRIRDNTYLPTPVARFVVH